MLKKIKTWWNNKIESWKLAWAIGKMQGEMITEMYFETISDGLKKMGLETKEKEEWKKQKNNELSEKKIPPKSE